MKTSITKCIHAQGPVCLWVVQMWKLVPDIFLHDRHVQGFQTPTARQMLFSSFGTVSFYFIFPARMDHLRLQIYLGGCLLLQTSLLDGFSSTCSALDLGVFLSNRFRYWLGTSQSPQSVVFVMCKTKISKLYPLQTPKNTRWFSQEAVWNVRNAEVSQILDVPRNKWCVSQRSAMIPTIPRWWYRRFKT